MQGIYDRRGECFGYIEKDNLYDLEHQHWGYVSQTEITTLDGKRVWFVDRDGVYDLHWQNIGYIGNPVTEGQHYDD